MSKRIDKVFKSSPEILFDDNSKIVLMSDCHRGDGSWADDFANNQNLYFAALTHYDVNKYTYIELGDGDELWENKKMVDVVREHSNVFWLLSRFYDDNRLYMIYGNHDINKRSSAKTYSIFKKYLNDDEKKHFRLFKDIKFYEGLVLKHKDEFYKIFLLHGHQDDWLNDKCWRLSRFLVRYLWRPLEIIGVNDPTSVAKNYKSKEKVEKRLSKWSDENNQLLVAGHTHRPVFPKIGDSLYFNDGSCVHPRCITAIEITGGEISLVKWSIKTKKDGSLYVGRTVLEGPIKLKKFLK